MSEPGHEVRDEWVKNTVGLGEPGTFSTPIYRLTIGYRVIVQAHHDHYSEVMSGWALTQRGAEKMAERFVREMDNG